MPRPADDLTATPGQTVGPFFGYALPFAHDSELVPHGHRDAVRLHGDVLDGAGAPVPDAIVEIWQPDPAGRVPREPGSLRRDGWTFTGWGRASTDDAGHYSFTTLRPGACDAGRPAFFAVAIFARGLMNRLATRAYLGDDPLLDADPLLSAVPEHRRSTLVAEPDTDGFRFDLRLQGAGETVFLSHRDAGV